MKQTTMNSEAPICKACGKYFNRSDNLRRHVSLKHPEKLHEIAPLKYKNKCNYRFSCDLCHRNFNIEKMFRCHLKSHEKVQEQLEKPSSSNDSENKTKTCSKCPLCSFSAFHDNKKMLKHFETAHEIAISSKDLEFTSLHDFEQWLLGFEKETQSKFIKNSTDRNSKGLIRTMYVCHRSGYYAPRGNGLRCLKIKGSVKINGHCPASIKLLQNTNGTFHVHYIETHVGHSCDSNLEYLFLTNEDRKTLASQIANEIPFDNILDGVKNSISNQKPKRIHLLRRTDLHNIQRSFNVNSEVPNCKECGKYFSRSDTLRKHVSEKHPEKLDEIAPFKYKKKGNYRFSCDVCHRNFNIEKQFRYHLKSHTKVQEQLEKPENKTKTCSKCPLCSFSAFHDNKKMLQHFETAHEIAISSKDMEFTSLHDFEQWLLGVEKETQSKFIKNNLDRTLKGLVRTTYVCHRSGFYVPRGNGLRCLKIKGSVKINGYCPASIKLVQYTNGTCHINFIETHVGHSCDSNLEYLFLTNEERKTIASQIASKIPFNNILDGVRDSISNQKLERIHLLRRKDLHNIQRSFNLTSSSTMNSEVEDNELFIHSDGEEDAAEAEIISNQLNKKRSAVLLNEEKEAMKKRFCALLDSIHSPEKLDIVRKVISPLSPNLAAAEKLKKQSFPPAENQPNNGNIVPQSDCGRRKTIEGKLIYILKNQITQKH